MFILFLLGLVADVIAYILNGFALSVLWGWFVVPVFHLAQLNIAPAIGFALVVGFLTHQAHVDMKKEEMTVIHKSCLKVGNNIGAPITALLVGWIVHLFM